MNRTILILIIFTSFFSAQEIDPETGLVAKTEQKNENLSIKIPSGVNIEVGGKVEFEFVDVEGSGGATNSDEFIQKINTRSPYVRIDKAVLNFKILYSKNISFRFGLRFNDDNAYVDKSYLLYKKNNSRLEIGSNRPAIALEREIEGYPLIGTAYWKGRQYHIDFEQKVANLTLGTSVALKRPLSFDAVAEDDSYSMLVYGNMPTKTRNWDGVTTEFGLRGELDLFPLKVMGWGYSGKLYDDYDWRILFDNFEYYRYTQGIVLPKHANRDHYWYGGRVELFAFGFLTRAEYIYSLDGYLDRDGFYVETRRKFYPSLFSSKEVLLLARFGSHRIKPNGAWEPILDDPHSWDRTLITLAASYSITEYAKVKFEYYITGEKTGDTLEKAESYNNNEGRAYQPDMEDNQFLIQFELKF